MEVSVSDAYNIMVVKQFSFPIYVKVNETNNNQASVSFPSPLGSFLYFVFWAFFHKLAPAKDIKC